ncbi:unnamed protein product [Lupinus luteus]|uniref:Uncharacterized protein n=1 Tax=Lupinus luteus TaxID=3873 RepID=A0AAV1XP58_LUPLU
MALQNFISLKIIPEKLSKILKKLVGVFIRTLPDANVIIKIHREGYVCDTMKYAMKTYMLLLKKEFDSDHHFHQLITRNSSILVPLHEIKFCSAMKGRDNCQPLKPLNRRDKHKNFIGKSPSQVI